MTGLLTPPFAADFRRVGQAEMQRDLAVTAIALKRNRLRHGAPAPTLAALVPEFLPRVPRDIMDGANLRYRLNPDGTWILYSVGEDGVDDGGNPNPPVGRARVGSFTEGRDAVWPQPASAAEVAREEEALRRDRTAMTREMMKRYGLIPRE
jgi:hypothetical protein